MNKDCCLYFCRNPQKNQKCEKDPVPFHKELTVLSNFEDKHPIKINNNLIALTAEHYFQSYKHINNKKLFKEILGARTKTGKVSPSIARKMGKGCIKTGIGRLNSFEIKKWNNDRYNIMCKVITEKFTQHLDLQQILLNTGNATLIENAPWDSYWGIGTNGNGQNMLGKILMKVRDNIR